MQKEIDTRRVFPWPAVFILVPVLLGIWVYLAHSVRGHEMRGEHWAEVVKARHIHNFYKIDEGFYRSGQPSPEGFRELEEMGFTDILNLRSQNTDDDEARGTSLTLHHIRMNAGSPDTGKLVEALRIIRNRKGPILLHCWHGSDRTGIIVALYRIIYQGWAKEEAIDELRYGGYGYHPFYHEIISYIRQADVQQLRQDIDRLP